MEPAGLVLVNTTFFLPQGLMEDFLKWFPQKYLDSAQNNGLQDGYCARVLDSPQPGVVGIAIAGTAPSLAVAQDWNDGPAKSLRDTLTEKYGQEVVFFTSFLEILNRV